MNTYKYFLTQRPPSIGTHPIDGLISIEVTQYNNRKCHLLTYDKELTTNEVIRFELTPDYSHNPLLPYEFEFAGIKIIEVPTLNGTIIESCINDERTASYSFLGWFRHTNRMFKN